MDAPDPLLLAPIGRRQVWVPLLSMTAAANGYALEVDAGAATAAGVVELIVPFPAGGSMDAVGRIVASALASALGDDVVVNNIGGASGAVGVRRFLQRPADGRTLLLASLTQLMQASGVAAVSTRFVPIGEVVATDFVIVSGSDFGPRTLDEFTDLARDRPGRISMAHPGQATLQYLSACLVEQRAGIELLLVPYSGSAPMLADLVAGQVDTALIAVPGAVSLIRGGRLKVLGLLRAQRQPALPGWPTSGESRSLRGLDVTAWVGLFGRAGTPTGRIDPLRRALAEAVRSPELRAAVRRMGSSPADPDQVSDAAGFARFVESEIGRYTRVQREALQRP